MRLRSGRTRGIVDMARMSEVCDLRKAVTTNERVDVVLAASYPTSEGRHTPTLEIESGVLLGRVAVLMALGNCGLIVAPTGVRGHV